MFFPFFWRSPGFKNWLGSLLTRSLKKNQNRTTARMAPVPNWCEGFHDWLPQNSKYSRKFWNIEGYHGWNRSKHHRISIVLLFLLQLTIIQKKKKSLTNKNRRVSRGLIIGKICKLHLLGDFSWSLKGLDVFDPIGDWSMKMGGRANIMDYSCFNMSTHPVAETHSANHLWLSEEIHVFLVSSLSPS